MRLIAVNSTRTGCEAGAGRGRYGTLHRGEENFRREACFLFKEPLYDEARLPRVLQVHELLDYPNGRKDADRILGPVYQEVRKLELTESWY